MDFLSGILVRVILTVALVGAYTMFALGIVFIYRGSKVLNLAHGAMAMFPAFVALSLVRGDLPFLLAIAISGVAAAGAAWLVWQWLAPGERNRRIGASAIAALVLGSTSVLLLQARLPVVLAIPVALLVGGLLGVVIERAVVRRLRAISPTAQTVGTVAVLGLLIAVAARIWGTTPVRGPSVFPEKSFQVGNSSLALGDIGIFVVALAVAGGFIALFRYTDLGLALRAAADNRRAAGLMGIDPERTTATAWFFAGVLAALGGVLLGASTNLHPFTLSLQVLPAFVAALLGGLESVTGALYGAAIVGLTVGIVPTLPWLGDQLGAKELGLALLAFVVMSLRGTRFSASDVRSGL